MTLLETLLSFTLFAIILALVINLFPSSLVIVKRSELRYFAHNIASSTLEDQCGLPFSQLSNSTTNQTIAGVQFFTNVTVTPGAAITNATWASGESSAYLYAVDVQVKWRYAADNQTVERKRLISRLANQSP